MLPVAFWSLLEVIFGEPSKKIVHIHHVVVLDRASVLYLLQQTDERHSHFLVRVVDQPPHTLRYIKLG